MEDFKTEIEQAILKEEQEKSEVRQIMLDKLKEMSEIEIGDCMDSCDYSSICSVMNDIARTLLDK